MVPQANLSSTPTDAVAYLNGTVYTVHESQPWAEAFIVSPKGTFTAVGSNADIAAQANKNGLVTYDLHHQFVMPGIHDAHMHIMFAGLAMLNEVDLPMDTTPDNLAGRMAEGSCGCAYAHVHGDWMMGNAFAVPGFDRACLDERYPDTPVYIHAGAGHSMYANTAALKEAGYDVDHEPDSQAARILRREDGSLTGELSELAMTKAALALPKPALSHVKRALRHAITAAHKVGVTSLQEASANTLLVAALAELEAEGRLTMDCYAHVVDAPEFLGLQPRKALHALIEAARDYESEHVHTNFVKFMMDGVPLPPLLTHCGLDEQGNADESKIVVADLAERILEHDSKGRTVKVHSTGRGSVRRVLDAFEAARRRNPNGPRHEVAHCNAIHEDDYARFRKLNVTAEMSPAIFFTHPLAAASEGLMEWSFEKLMHDGAHITLGSDWGGTFEPSLLPHCAGIASRVGGGSQEEGGRRICRMLTLAGAEAVGREKEFGTIEVGKKANFITVSRNLAKGEFEDARVLKTWSEGEVVWDGESGS